MEGDASTGWTVLSILKWTKAYFARAGLETPRLAAEVLLAHVLGCRRIELYARHDYPPTGQQRRRYRELIARAARGEPVAYLVGGKEFYSLWFTVTGEVLIPRSETELLVDEAVARLRRCGNERPHLWDACTGCGAVAVAGAHEVPGAVVLATDASRPAVAVAHGNAAAHDLGDRVTCRVASLLELPDGCDAFAACDVITANPPYVAEGDTVGPGVVHEPRQALYAGTDGLDVLRPLIAQAPRRLRAGGALIVEFGAHHADAVRDLVVATGAFDEPRIVRDHQGIERVAVAVRSGA
ncbi:MAG: peptide chain release factor N(5)-glutamine methyltransferase [Phycisphaerae bacterium]|nr:peptide chain release factor N(5)-glutamine methyltransferase [Phycisphaerae bacterium]